MYLRDDEFGLTRYEDLPNPFNLCLGILCNTIYVDNVYTLNKFLTGYVSLQPRQLGYICNVFIF